jgi:hypothetical protein
VQFFITFFSKDILAGTTPMTGGFGPSIPSERIMGALGSWTNDKQFRMLQKRLNGMKAQVICHPWVNVSRPLPGI